MRRQSGQSQRAHRGLTAALASAAHPEEQSCANGRCGSWLTDKSGACGGMTRVHGGLVEASACGQAEGGYVADVRMGDS